jgi:Winged helix-turn-helix DNA-binding
MTESWDLRMIEQWLLPLIEHAVAFERAARPITAAAALAKVRERHAALASTDLAADEQTWADFAHKRVPLPPERIDELIGGMVHRGGLLQCTKCGAGTICACGCGVPYVGEHRAWAAPIAKVPTALERAAAAIAADPAKSNRAIAKEIGVSDQTVRRARRQLEDAGNDVALDHAPPK